MNKYEIRTNKKRKAIISAALKLFSEKGFANTGIKEIAALADVSQVSIYNYFGSKDALAAECIKLVVEDNLKHALELLETNMDFEKKLLSALSICTGGMCKSMTEYFSADSLADKSFCSILTDSIKSFKKEVYLKYIEVGKRDGAIDPSIPDSIILKFADCISTIEIDPLNYDCEIEAMHRLFLYGLLGNKTC